MQDRKRLARRTAPRALLSTLGPLGIATALLGGRAGAQTPPRLVVSTTGDVKASQGLAFVADGDLVAVGGGGSPTGYFTEAHWLAVAGLSPGDVDAFGFLPGSQAGRRSSFAFSLLSNENGFLDGDVLGLAAGGGIRVLVPEATLLAALGRPGGAIDVDALDYDDQGRLLFSLQSDLDGTVLGLVEDGDVLRLESDGSVSLVVNEPTVDVCFSLATGLAPSVGDVQGIEWVNGELWVSVQSPSTHDGGVLGCGPTPQMVIEESAVGLGGEELDALSLLDPAAEIPGFTVSPRRAPAGTKLQAEFHGDPNSTHLVLMSGGAGYVSFGHVPGFGAWYLDPTDPWFVSFWTLPAPPLVLLDPTGSYVTTFPLPTAPVSGVGWGGEPGWTLQMIDLATLELSAPVRIEEI